MRPQFVARISLSVVLLSAAACREAASPPRPPSPWQTVSASEQEALPSQTSAAGALEANRLSALLARRDAPSAEASVALVHAYFPELAPLSTSGAKVVASARDDGGRALGVQLHDPATLTIETRGLVFQVARTTDNGAVGPLRREGEALLADARHLWLPAGRLYDTERGWRTARVDEAWVLDSADGVHRTEYEVQLPPSVTRVRSAGDYLELLGADERPVLRFHPSEARDAEGRRRRGTIELADAAQVAPQLYAVNAGRLRVASEVALAALTPPLVIDPGWSSTANMAKARTQHAMAQLTTGEILVSGGLVNSFQSDGSSELYDPNTGTWSAGPGTAVVGNFATAAPLPTGEVLVFSDYGNAAIFDPVQREWTNLPAMTPKLLPTVNLLRSGQVLIAGGENSPTALLFDPATRSFTPTGAMVAAHRAATSALLLDGRVLVAGGQNSSGIAASAELFNPATGSWTPAAPPLVPARYSAATLLRDGRVLKTGGSSSGPVAELYDPDDNTWTATGAMAAERASHTQTLLPDGRVLVANGATSGGSGSTEVYDPATGVFTDAGDVPPARDVPVAVLLPSGRVLLTGGSSINSAATYADADIFDPDVSSALPAGAMSAPRDHATATLLPTGRVLIVGGASQASAELFDPATLTATPAATPLDNRRAHSAVVLPDGEVLVLGGFAAGRLASVERYDPAANAWTPSAPMATARSNFTATLLPSGKVLVAGGIGPVELGSPALNSAELYDPATDSWTPAAPLSLSRVEHVAVLLPTGKVLVAGGYESGIARASAELYDPESNTWSPAAPLSVARHSATATLLGSGKVLVAGGLGASTLSSAELYDPATDSWTAAGALATARTRHAAVGLPSGLVMVAGGVNGGGVLASLELYDPALNTWSAAADLTSARSDHAAVPLPRGRVLILGGLGGTGTLASTELFDVGGAHDAWRPSVTGPDVLLLGCEANVRGLALIDSSEGSSGATFVAPSNLPLVRLTPNEGSGLWTIPARELSASGLRITTPLSLTPGQYTLSVLRNGVYAGRVVRVQRDTAPVPSDAALSTEHATPVSFTLEATDAEPDQALFWRLLDQPAHGTLSGTPPELVYTPAPGFVGQDQLTFEVSSCGATSEVATITFTVQDTVPPEILCPASFEVEATGSEGTTATAAYPSATASDAATQSPTVTFEPPPGAALPLGVTTVTATARDEAGNEASCTFEVSVSPRVSRFLGGGCSSSPGAPGGFSLLLVAAGLLFNRRRQRREVRS